MFTTMWKSFILWALVERMETFVAGSGPFEVRLMDTDIGFVTRC